MHKTQVFIFPQDEHFRTRMTHTLEVAQISRIIARALRLNEDLCEAAALGHDLGHTPFGHAGEHAMQLFYSKDFTHNKQSLRVVEKLERDGKGLNLTWEVKDAILNHSGGCVASTLEGQIVNISDRIAYINHDIDDAVRGNVLTETRIPADVARILGSTKSKRINTLVTSAIENTVDVPTLGEDEQWAFDVLHEFMFEQVYTNPVCKSEEEKAIELVKHLYHHFAEHPADMPNEYVEIAWRDGAERAACDYIAGMTDKYAVSVFESIFVPKGWVL